MGSLKLQYRGLGVVATRLLYQTDGPLLLRRRRVNGSPAESPLCFTGSAREVARQIAAFMNGAL